MSQCFTCPPLVISRNQASGQNLVESTKLERVIIDSKKAHRKEKKEKKEKRKHKKEKLDKSHKHSSRKADVQFLSSKKISDESTDQREKSDLTDELGGPQNHLGYLSDGSQNSKKRKRDDSPPAVESLIKVAAAPVAGNPLRIRLIFKKPKADVPLLPQEKVDLVCSTSSAESLSHKEKVSPEVITSSVSSSKVSQPRENLPSTSVAAVVESKKRKKHRPSKEERYNALFDGWTPSSLCFAPMEVDSSKDDDEWLFGNRTQEKLNAKEAIKIDEDLNMGGGDSSWPRAQFLSEVGIHSLPYTVLF